MIEGKRSKPSRDANKNAGKYLNIFKGMNNKIAAFEGTKEQLSSALFSHILYGFLNNK
jgi:hypothetical protein